MTVKLFFKGLGAAALGGAVTSGIDAFSSGSFNIKHLAASAAAGAALAVAAYLKQPPTK